LHGTERVRVTPAGQDDVSEERINQTIIIQATDADSFRQQMRQGLAVDLEFFGSAIGNELARRPEIKASLRE
jgi:hypothetical protein